MLDGTCQIIVTPQRWSATGSVSYDPESGRYRPAKIISFDGLVNDAGDARQLWVTPTRHAVALPFHLRVMEGELQGDFSDLEHLQSKLLGTDCDVVRTCIGVCGYYKRTAECCPTYGRRTP